MCVAMPQSWGHRISHNIILLHGQLKEDKMQQRQIPTAWGHAGAGFCGDIAALLQRPPLAFCRAPWFGKCSRKAEEGMSEMDEREPQPVCLSLSCP